MRLTTARYYTPSGRSIQALGVAPDIVVQQPPVKVEDPAPVEPTTAVPTTRSEADLRGILSNDSMTEAERTQAEAELKAAEDAAKLRDEDYQLAYAIDVLKGLSVLDPQ